MLAGIMSGRIEALEAKKGILEARIEQEHSRPQPDTIRLQSLKRMRLRLKDDIVRMRVRASRVARKAFKFRRDLTLAH